MEEPTYLAAHSVAARRSWPLIQTIHPQKGGCQEAYNTKQKKVDAVLAARAGYMSAESPGSAASDVFKSADREGKGWLRMGGRQKRGEKDVITARGDTSRIC